MVNVKLHVVWNFYRHLHIATKSTIVTLSMYRNVTLSMYRNVTLSMYRNVTLSMYRNQKVVLIL